MHFNRTIRRRKTGTILVIAIVVLTFVMLLGAALARAVFVFHQQAQVGERRQQAFLLAESAVQRGMRGAKNGDYRGETWHVPAEQLGNRGSATVEIRVETLAESTTQRRLVVDAVYPDQGTWRAVYRRELLINVPAESARSAEAAADPAS